MKRRAAVEPVIGHLKADHRMDRNYLKGQDGDRINAVRARPGPVGRYAQPFVADLDPDRIEDEARSSSRAADSATRRPSPRPRR